MSPKIGENFVSDRWLGIVRSLLAVSTLITLLANDARHLFFFENEAVISGEACSNLGFFCFFNAFDSGHIYIAKAIAITVLALVISGWFPRWTALPHWLVSFGFAHAVALPDGGDQINAVLTFLMMPLAIFDARKNHWNRRSMPAQLDDEGLTAKLLRAATLLCRIQCHFIYFDAAVDKMKVSEWRNGTALYYWFQDPVVGPPFKGPQIWVDLFNGFPIVLIMVTWSVLVLEILIGMSWMWSQRARIILCSAGIIFHLSIIINHGLTSFFFTMTAVLIIIAFGEKQYSNKGTFV